jgi:hypothetical protein
MGDGGTNDSAGFDTHTRESGDWCCCYSFFHCSGITHIIVFFAIRCSGYFQHVQIKLGKKKKKNHVTDGQIETNSSLEEGDQYSMCPSGVKCFNGQEGKTDDAWTCPSVWKRILQR